ncbi:hypothetical protein Tco_1281055, partial [Tanacetum coccineum]
IMPLRTRTQSAGRLVAESRGGGTGERENIRNVLVNGNWVGCSYKEFLACNPKEYDGKGGVVVLTRWIEKMESMQDMSGCSIDQKEKYTAGSLVEEFCPSHEMQKLETELWNHAMVGAGHAAYTDRFHELASALTDEAVRNGSIKNTEKRGNVWEPSKDKKGRDDNKRTRTGNAFATTANAVGRGNTGAWPKCTTTTSSMHPEGLVAHALTVTAQVILQGIVELCLGILNRAQGPGGNRPNQVASNNEGQGRGIQGNQARGRAFTLGAEEAHQDPNIVTGIEPSELGFRYEIEISSGQLVEIDK